MKNNSPIYFVICIHCLGIIVIGQHTTNTISHLSDSAFSCNSKRGINSEQMWQSSDSEVDLSQISVLFTVHYRYINATPIHFHLESTFTSNESKITCRYILLRPNQQLDCDKYWKQCSMCQTSS